MKLKSFIFFFIAILFLLNSVANGNTIASKKEGVSADNVIVCALFDLSKSTKELRTNYLKAFKHVLSNLKYGSIIAGVKITSSSILEPELLFIKQFPVPSPKTDNRLEILGAKKVADRAINEIVNRITETAERILLAEGTSSTDIMTAFPVAERIFIKYKGYRPILIVFSDLVETANYNFARSSIQIDKIIKKEIDSGRLSNLQHADVYIIAASSGSLDQYFARQQFWIQYVIKSNGSIKKANYGSDYQSVLPLSFYTSQ